MNLGIEKLNFYGGAACINVIDLANHRKLDIQRFENLLMEEKTVPLPIEDTVSFGVNAAKPILDQMSEAQINEIELLITCTESGIDFSKSVSTYIHKYLGLKNNCRMFEIKNACYSGVAGLQVALDFVRASHNKNVKALVIASDIARFMAEEKDGNLTMGGEYAEPSSGAGAVAALVSNHAKVFRVDIGANGYYGMEVCDTCRPVPDSEVGNADLSLLTYLDCCENSYKEYCKRVEGVDYKETFDYLSFHTPFAGMVKGAHRSMMRKFTGMRGRDEIETDFIERVTPGLNYCKRVGNIMGATALLSLLSTIDQADFTSTVRIGCFSYGSGCCSEFFSGVSDPEAKSELRKMEVKKRLRERYHLSMNEYDELLKTNVQIKFGTRNIQFDISSYVNRYQLNHSKLLFLESINDFHRIYKWV